MLGELLRREGLYSSHLTTWRRQRDEGALAGLTPKRRGRKAKPKNPLADEVARLQRENRAAEGAAPPGGVDHRRSKKSLRDVEHPPEDPRRRRGRLMDATEKLAPEVGTAAACRAMGVARATLYRRRKPSRPKTGDRPKRRQPRALDEAERRRVLDLLHSPRFVDKAPAAVYASALGRRDVPLLDSHDVPHLARRPRGPRTSQSAAASEVQEARTAGHGAQPGLVVGHYQAAWGRPNGPTTTCT